MANYPSDEQLAEMVRQLTQARIENWLGECFGTWRWWLLVALLIMPWIAWFKLVEKKKIVELSLYGIIIMVVTITLDEVGFVLSMWHYPLDVFPMLPRLTSIDYALLPVTYMLIYQYFSSWKSFFRVMAIASAFFSFIAEPLMTFLGFYQLLTWKHYYSYPIYIVLALACKWLTRIIIDMEDRTKEK
ncbi:hypothetical protein Ga0466249_003816 [Sporomusaceae bacterium BoRhaA]|uniref:CBO0543 family protein n=1 Tax=Pelorhabdus rhamnosifermentans TaxID=2772457 RepID=UPI001C05FBA0|nr:CBO0543 family protein [Pelorhabdus rhamnosifermentans]MBU2702681.1 hypothetical protein [Pelorhabdus rhamnosifermentans]